ncbi:hypothetical protein DACRYDRAFT_101489 [Dacryopinax primogenitus]|uniref:3'-5' exonuclease domain-containing protein n=1 Tax=Dacryopinax primogenitus (strain DJM 731) TaxID=1858805 RepID=M5G6P3_DACPD|nr:uncharacterized protein DACRYDRAFT_101489 [Dacryopinax primogenitus]EJT99432.1 hypothetical protein DACRYDRAFT_101489 [Dacryopinax primogenitus]
MSTPTIESLVAAMAATSVEEEKVYIYCTTEEAVAEATAVLTASEYVILDSEGQSLGRVDGKLSLVCIGTPHAGKIFVFDAVSVTKSIVASSGLAKLLEDESIRKVVWDGRMDYLEMLISWGVSMKGALDLQLAEIVSRGAVRGEQNSTRLYRLKDGFFSSLNVSGQAHLFEGLHLVLGMQKCLEQLDLDKEFTKDPYVQKMHKIGRSDRWMERPLSDRLIAYAAQDIKLLGKLYDTFQDKRWITPSGLSSLAQMSDRYLTMFQTRAQSVAYESRRIWIVLPLDILTTPTGRKHTCSYCSRSLSESCYEFDNGRTRRRPPCRLCHVVSMKRGASVNSWVSA